LSDADDFEELFASMIIDPTGGLDGCLDLPNLPTAKESKGVRDDVARLASLAARKPGSQAARQVGHR